MYYIAYDFYRLSTCTANKLMLLTCIWLNSLVTMKEQPQAKAVAMPLAAPLALEGNISDMMSQGMGPHANENEMM